MGDSQSRPNKARVGVGTLLPPRTARKDEDTEWASQGSPLQIVGLGSSGRLTESPLQGSCRGWDTFTTEDTEERRGQRVGEPRFAPTDCWVGFKSGDSQSRPYKARVGVGGHFYHRGQRGKTRTASGRAKARPCLRCDWHHYNPSPGPSPLKWGGVTRYAGCKVFCVGGGFAGRVSTDCWVGFKWATHRVAPTRLV